MKKIIFLICLYLLIFVPQGVTSDVSKPHTWTDGETPTAALWNANEDAIITEVNDLDGDNLASDIVITTSGTCNFTGTFKLGGTALTATATEINYTDGVTSAIQTQLDNKFSLPSGAIFFMVTGSCPAGTTDVTATYSDKFVRINATGGSTGGANTHTHGAGSYKGPHHYHSIPHSGWAQNPPVGGKINTSDSGKSAAADRNTGGGGDDSVTGTSASASNVPTYVTAKCCQVN